jgi:beta-fructofuranosidase
VVRPDLHFTPERGWINDPHGVTWHDGRYHAFFQHVPGQTAWRPQIHWGHAVSHDLVHWAERPVVLSPGDGDHGVWSGCVVTTEAEAARLFYTAVRADAPGLGAVRVARPDDAGWEVWHKGGTVVVPPTDLDLAEFRDPVVLHDGTAWRMVVGGGTSGGTGVALSWTSPDLESWTYDGILASRPGSERDPVWTGTAWECVQLFPLDGRWVLLVSVWDKDVTQYEACAVGDLEGGRFHAGAWQRLTYGPAHYAGSVFTDEAGRRCLIHWLRGVADPEGRWAGAHSVPHVLRLEGDRVVLDPHPHVAAACQLLEPGSRRTFGDAVITLGPDHLTAEIGNDSFTMPCSDGSVRILVDGPIVEVFTPHGVAGFTTPPPSRAQ